MLDGVAMVGYGCGCGCVGCDRVSGLGSLAYSPAKSCQGERPSAGNAPPPPPCFISPATPHFTSKAIIIIIITTITTTTTLIHFTTIMHCLRCIDTISAIGADKHPWH
jgi:hypothetical protein